MYECGICGKQCKNPNALRWHFDKCQRNSQTDSQTNDETGITPNQKEISQTDGQNIEESDTSEKKSFWDTDIFSGWFS